MTEPSTHLANDDPPLARPRRSWLRWLLLAASIVVGGFYLCCLHPFTNVWQERGWYAECRFLLLACPVCTGEVRRLEYAGRPVPAPVLHERETLVLDTPVGIFRTRHDRSIWTWYGGPEVREPSDIAVTDEERRRGYYEIEPFSRAPKAETPLHWCRAQSPHVTRWLDPARLAELDWSETTATKPDDATEH
jgi:hypothetical protein